MLGIISIGTKPYTDTLTQISATVSTFQHILLLRSWCHNIHPMYPILDIKRREFLIYIYINICICIDFCDGIYRGHAIFIGRIKCGSNFISISHIKLPLTTCCNAHTNTTPNSSKLHQQLLLKPISMGSLHESNHYMRIVIMWSR